MTSVSVPTVTDEHTVLTRVHDRLREAATDATVDTIASGDRVVLVELATDAGRTAGVAHLPAGEMPDTGGQTASTLARWAIDAEGPVARRAVGVATLNALSAPHVHWQPGDPMAALSADVDRITTVGLFRPAFRKFSGVDVRVVERDPGAISVADLEPGDDVSVSLFGPDESGEAFDGADVAFVTGSTLIYGGLERYLAAADDGTLVVLIGATASILPEPCFAAGVDVLAGVDVVDRVTVRDRITAGDCGTSLHGAGLRKSFVAAENPAGLDLPAAERKTTPADR